MHDQSGICKILSVRMKLVGRHWYLWQGTKSAVQTEQSLNDRTECGWLKMVNVSLKLCRNRRREEQQHAQLNTLWAADAISNRQTGRDHWAFLSMPYVNQWIIQGGGGCEVVFPQSGRNPQSLFSLQSSSIQTAGCRPKLATESVKKRTALTLHWEGQPNHFVHPLLVGYTRPNMGQTKNCNSP